MKKPEAEKNSSPRTSLVISAEAFARAREEVRREEAAKIKLKVPTVFRG